MPRAITSTQVCQLLGITSKTLYLWEEAGKIPRAGRDRRGWRVYSPQDVQAIRRHAGRGEQPDGAPRADSPDVSHLTARNQIRGRVVSITSDGLLSEVVLRLGDGQEIVSVVTRSSTRRLGLRKGMDATAIIKATEVMLFT